MEYFLKWIKLVITYINATLVYKIYFFKQDIKKYMKLCLCCVLSTQTFKNSSEWLQISGKKAPRFFPDLLDYLSKFSMISVTNHI